MSYQNYLPISNFILNDTMCKSSKGVRRKKIPIPTGERGASATWEIDREGISDLTKVF